MAQYGSLLILSHDKREGLTRWAQSRTLPTGDVFRARLILTLADVVQQTKRPKRYIVLDNLSAHKTKAVEDDARTHQVLFRAGRYLGKALMGVDSLRL